MQQPITRRFRAAPILALTKRLNGPIAGVTVILFALTVLLFGIGGIVRQQRTSMAWVTKALTLLDLTANLNAHLERTISESRAYAISRDPGDRVRSDAAARQIEADLAELKALQPDNPALAHNFDRLRVLIEARLRTLGRIRSIVMAGEQASPRLAEDFQSAVGQMALVLDVIADIKAESTSLLKQHETDAARATRWLTSGIVLGSAVVVTILLVTAGLMITAAREIAHTKALRNLNARLETRVRERTAELAASEARQRGYFEGAPIGMFVMRPIGNGEFVHEAVNPAAAAIYGQPRDSMVGRTLRQIWPEPVAHEIEKCIGACLSQRQTLHEVAERTLHGTSRTIDIILVPLRDEQQAITRVLSCVHDVTEQRALERKVLAQAEQESAFFRNSTELLYVVRVDQLDDDPVFTYEAVSPTVEAWIGMPPSSIVGRQPEDCFEPRVALSITAQYKACLAAGTTYRYSISYPRTLGVRDTEGWVSPVRHPATGRIIRLVGASRDVTERNRTEALLRQTQTMEALGRLAAGVAHDFNNVLQTIIGGLELVLDEVAPGTEAHEFAQVAIATAERGTSLTQHLLSYTRMQSLVPQAIEPESFLNDLKTFLLRLLGVNIAIEVSVAPGTPKLFADPGQLQMALLNLAINAGQAMASKGRLTIAASHNPVNCGDWVCLVVTDTGCGMDEATLMRATDPFFSTKGANGSGLGLSMVKGFAEQSGGELHLTSRVGHGTRVALHLPLAPTTATAQTAPSDTVKTGRILLVDDMTDVLITTSAFLSRSGLDVVQACNGEDALALMSDGTGFDALVTDFAMPGINGADLIAQCRRIQPNLPALVITGFVAPDDTIALPDGVAVLRKPFSRSVLLQAIAAVIAGVTLPADGGGPSVAGSA